MYIIGPCRTQDSWWRTGFSLNIYISMQILLPDSRYTQSHYTRRHSWNKAHLPWYQTGGDLIAVLKLHSIIAGVCGILNGSHVSEHALAHADSKCACRGRVKVDLLTCSSKLLFFFIFPHGNYCIVFSFFTNRTFWVREFTRSWKHSYACVTRPKDQTCTALPTNPLKKTPR